MRESSLLRVTLQRIKSWYSYRRTLQGREASGFEKYAHQLNDRGPAPKKLPIHKYYMQHDDYRQDCLKAYTERAERDNVDTDHVLAVRCAVALELWQKEGKETQAKVTAQWEADHKAALEEWTALGLVKTNTDPLLRKL